MSSSIAGHQPCLVQELLSQTVAEVWAITFAIPALWFHGQAGILHRWPVGLVLPFACFGVPIVLSLHQIP